MQCLLMLLLLLASEIARTKLLFSTRRILRSERVLLLQVNEENEYE